MTVSRRRRDLRPGAQELTARVRPLLISLLMSDWPRRTQSAAVCSIQRIEHGFGPTPCTHTPPGARVAAPTAKVGQAKRQSSIDQARRRKLSNLCLVNPARVALHKGRLPPISPGVSRGARRQGGHRLKRHDRGRREEGSELLGSREGSRRRRVVCWIDERHLPTDARDGAP